VTYWQETLRESVTSVDELVKRFGVDHIDQEAVQRAIDSFNLRITPEMLNLIKEPDGPIWRYREDHATSLLYRKTKAGYDLIGAMYTAPANASEFDLDARVPLSVTQWHQHINICLPPRGTAANADWKKFGPEGSIVAADACRAAGGRFFERLFGWMVHVYPFEKTSEQIWSMDPSQAPEAR